MVKKKYNKIKAIRKKIKLSLRGDAMDKSNLTSRQKSIILLLTQFTAKNPVTISTLSEKLKLSSRTILREMPSVEKWLKEKQFRFIRKPGVGLMLDETIERQQELFELLQKENVEQSYSKEERIALLLGELLTSKEPLKSYYFTSKFKISDGTLSNDLDEAQEQLKTFEIELIRKPGIGIYLKGGENNYRQAMVQLLYKIMDEKELIHLLSGKITEKTRPKLQVPIQNRLLHFIDQETIEIIEIILGETEKKLKIKYTDSAYIGLVVHIALAIKRIENNEKIIMDQATLSELRSLPEFSVSAAIAAKLEEKFLIEIPESEIGYITMHLKGAKLRLARTKEAIDLEQLNYYQIAAMMIDSVENQLGVVLDEKEQLEEDIANHLGPAISRLTMNLKIKNPQKKEIQETYPRVYQATEKACEIIKEITKVAVLPESEIAYIAMHFGAALERSNCFDSRFQVVIVCPTGVGTSRLLAANIKKEYANIEIHSIISALHIDTKKLKEQEIDLIISTVELNVDYPFLYVSPLMTEQDKEKLKKYLGRAKKKIIQNKKRVQKRSCSSEDIQEITQWGIEINALLENIRLHVLEEVSSIQELTADAGILFAESGQAAEEMTEKLFSREHLGSTYIDETQMFLFHCKSGFLSHSRFGVIRLKEPVKIEGKKIAGGIVFMIPEEDSGICREIISEISGKILDDSALLHAILHQGEKELRKEIECLLCFYYQKKIKKRMEMLEYEKPDSEIW